MQVSSSAGCEGAAPLSQGPPKVCQLCQGDETVLFIAAAQISTLFLLLLATGKCRISPQTSWAHVDLMSSLAGQNGDEIFHNPDSNEEK